MKNTRYRLTPGLMQQIVSGIRAGGYPHIAAGAFGIPDAVFAQWLRRGEAAGARAPYAVLAAEVRQAQAQARLRAENEVFSDKVQVWLEHGPGRERAGQPGWSAAVKGPAPLAQADANAWLSSGFVALVRGMLGQLDDMPEARARLSGFLAGTDAAVPRPLADRSRKRAA